MAEAKNPDEMLDVPCLAFLVEKNGQRFMWDLGLMEVSEKLRGSRLEQQEWSV